MTSRQEIDGNGAIDVEVEKAIDVIVKEELSLLGKMSPEEQESQLGSLLARVEQRAVEEVDAFAELGDDEASSGDGGQLSSSNSGDKKGYQFGDVSRAVASSVRGEVQRQMDADWSMDDLGLLLKIGIFLGAGAAAPAAGLAAMPAAVLLATYGTVLKAELGVRAVQEVGVRATEMAAQGVRDGVADYTGKEEYRFGDLTEATVQKVTGSKDYKFGDLTRGAVKSVTGKDEYKFGDVTKSLFRRLRKTDEKAKE